MRIIFLALITCTLLLGCEDQGTPLSADPASQLSEGETLIGTYEVEPSGSVRFEHTLGEPVWIGFTSDISWEEVDRFKSEENEFSSVTIHQLGSNKMVGSHRGAATVFDPSHEEPSQFEIKNLSREKLTITVYWKPE